jgi:hypothetical protein
MSAAEEPEHEKDEPFTRVMKPATQTLCFGRRQVRANEILIAVSHGFSRECGPRSRHTRRQGSDMAVMREALALDNRRWCVT